MTATLRRLRLPWAALLLLMPWAGRASDPPGVMPLSSFPREPITVETHSARRLAFDAWRAETPAQREQGLMFVKSLAPEQAMIFVYDPPDYVAMWMKNTFIPLDMLFVDARGCVVGLKEHARPRSLDTIAAPSPVALVVELKDGTVAARGIRRGDRVVRPEARWPADPTASCATSR